MDEVGVTVIGAGVVGLAVAAALRAAAGPVVVLERHERFGQETSSRNSEVIHSGIYYPEGSLKARLCVEGAELLYRYCRDNSIRFRKTGKLIVATEEAEVADLDAMVASGIRNGVRGLTVLGGDEVRKKEPGVRAHAAIFCPDTGIFDSHGFMNRLCTDASSSGVVFSFSSEVARIEKKNKGYVISLRGEDYRFFSRVVINSAGLSAHRIAEMAGIDGAKERYALQYWKGSYFAYEKRSPLSMPVYPVPPARLKGLGIHATPDLAGRLRFGPDTEYVETVDYRVDAGKRDAFYEGASRFIDGLDREAFIPDTAGVRPKIGGEGIQDFVIRHEGDRGFEGFINLIGIESPGLTASLAIGREVAEIVKGMG